MVDLGVLGIRVAMRQRVDVVELKETEPKGYQFNVCGADYWLRYEDGAWRLMRGEESDLFESFNEAMHFVLESC